jgi:hypothetical protein
MKRVIIASTEDKFVRYNLAPRLVRFMQDYDWYDYSDVLEVGETEEDAIESVINSLSTKEGAKGILDFLNVVLSEDADIDKFKVKGLINDITSLEKTNFDKKLIDKLRNYADYSDELVYVDVFYPDGKIVGDLKGYVGNRVRIVYSDGYYSDEDTFYDNESLAKYVQEIENRAKEEAKDLGMPDEWEEFVFLGV